jgi:DNA-binding transcriptional LysR family regulator
MAMTEHRARKSKAPQAALARDGLRRALHSRALTYFAAVAETLSIRGAARHLNIASSAVNRQILLLEHVVGTHLFERRGRSLALSPVGQVLARHVRETQAGLDALIEEVDSLYALRSGTVRIASIDSFACGLLPEIVLEFSRLYPLIRLSISVQPSRLTHALVASGDADIGFSINPPAGLHYTIAAHYPLVICAVVAASHPLAQRSEATIKDCLAYPILRGTRPETRRLIDRAVGKEEVIQNFIESNSSRFKAALVQRGDYIAFSPALGLVPLITEGKLVQVPLTDKRETDTFAIIVHTAGLRPAPKAFLEFSRKMIAKRHLPISQRIDHRRRAKPRRSKE